MKKRSDEMQTLHASCSNAEPKNFGPLQTPFPGVQDSQNLISWRQSLPLPTNPVRWGSMNAILSYRGNRPTNSQMHGGLQCTVTQLSAQRNNNNNEAFHTMQIYQGRKCAPSRQLWNGNGF